MVAIFLDPTQATVSSSVPQSSYYMHDKLQDFSDSSTLSPSSNFGSASGSIQAIFAIIGVVLALISLAAAFVKVKCWSCYRRNPKPTTVAPAPTCKQMLRLLEGVAANKLSADHRPYWPSDMYFLEYPRKPPRALLVSSIDRRKGNLDIDV